MKYLYQGTEPNSNPTKHTQKRQEQHRKYRKERKCITSTNLQYWLHVLMLHHLPAKLYRE